MNDRPNYLQECGNTDETEKQHNAEASPSIAFLPEQHAVT